MNKPTHINPNGAEILPCADDAACEITSCQMCMKEVPISATLSDEGSDYLHHFCGLDCLEVWRRQAQQAFADELSGPTPDTHGG